MLSALSASRRALAISAWWLATAVVLSVVAYLPSVMPVLEDMSAVVLGTILGATGVAAIVLWFSSVWHALLRQRPLIAMILLCTNVVGGLIYYFGFVIRQPHTRP